MMRHVLDLDPVSVCDVTKLVARGVLAAGQLTPRGAVVYELRDVDAFESFVEHAGDMSALEDSLQTARACDDGECWAANERRDQQETHAATMSNARQALYKLAEAVEGLKSATARRQLAAAMTELEGALES